MGPGMVLYLNMHGPMTHGSFIMLMSLSKPDISACHFHAVQHVSTTDIVVVSQMLLCRLIPQDLLVLPSKPVFS